MPFRDATLEEIESVWQERWDGFVVSLSGIYRPSDVQGALVLDASGSPSALVTWSVPHAEIVSLDAWGAGRPGRAAIRHAEQRLREAGLGTVRLSTTNDNLGAIMLYLRAGYRLIRVHLDVMEEVAKLKPNVPTTGLNGLPLRDVLELQKDLS